MFTNLYFKVLLNTVAVPRLHRFMLNFWLLVFEKVQAIKDKTETTFHVQNPSHLFIFDKFKENLGKTVKPLFYTDF